MPIYVCVWWNSHGRILLVYEHGILFEDSQSQVPWKVGPVTEIGIQEVYRGALLRSTIKREWRKTDKAEGVAELWCSHSGGSADAMGTPEARGCSCTVIVNWSQRALLPSPHCFASLCDPMHWPVMGCGLSPGWRVMLGLQLSSAEGNP